MIVLASVRGYIIDVFASPRSLPLGARAKQNVGQVLQRFNCKVGALTIGIGFWAPL